MEVCTDEKMKSQLICLHDRLPVQEDTTYVVAHVRAPNTVQTKPRNVIFCVDTSKSMERIMGEVQATERLVVSDLTGNDTFTLIEFGTHVTVVVDNMRMTPVARPIVEQAINRQVPSGMTATHACLLAIAERSTNTESEIYLFTDGNPTVGPGIDKHQRIATERPLLEAARAIVGRMHVFGFGFANMALLERLFPSTSYINSADSIPAAVGDVVQHYRQTVCRSVEVELTSDSSNVHHVDGDLVLAGMSCGQVHTALYRITPLTTGPVKLACTIRVDDEPIVHTLVIRRGVKAVLSPDAGRVIEARLLNEFNERIESAVHLDPLSAAFDNCRKRLLNIANEVDDPILKDSLQQRLDWLRAAMFAPTQLERSNSVTEVSRKRPRRERSGWSLDRVPEDDIRKFLGYE